MNENLI